MNGCWLPYGELRVRLTDAEALSMMRWNVPGAGYQDWWAASFRHHIHCASATRAESVFGHGGEVHVAERGVPCFVDKMMDDGRWMMASLPRSEHTSMDRGGRLVSSRGGQCLYRRMHVSPASRTRMEHFRLGEERRDDCRSRNLPCAICMNQRASSWQGRTRRDTHYP